MSLQITILRVLTGHTGGKATLIGMKADIGILIGSRDFTARMKILADRAPDLDIFSQGYVVRDETGWRITEVGRQFLVSIETTDRVSEAPGWIGILSWNAGRGIPGYHCDR
jgi:hypothetical protein